MYNLNDEYHTNNNIVYVGRTNDFERRCAEHARGRYPMPPHIMIPVATGLSLEQSRALEQILILTFGKDNLNNYIYSISRSKYSKFMSIFIEMIRTIKGW